MNFLSYLYTIIRCLTALYNHRASILCHQRKSRLFPIYGTQPPKTVLLYSPISWPDITQPRKNELPIMVLYYGVNYLPKGRSTEEVLKSQLLYLCCKT